MTRTKDPIVVFDHVAKSFASKPVLQDVSLTVAEGEANTTGISIYWPRQ
jgi:ABC-type transporter Mla maintaining outer membrane lipid asymmetry ATPase subunit MlaF